MDLFTQITLVYPELTNIDFRPNVGSIELCDDGDGIQYISKWEYSKPIPDGLKLGKQHNFSRLCYLNAIINRYGKAMQGRDTTTRAGR